MRGCDVLGQAAVVVGFAGASKARTSLAGKAGRDARARRLCRAELLSRPRVDQIREGSSTIDSSPLVARLQKTQGTHARLPGWSAPLISTPLSLRAAPRTLSRNNDPPLQQRAAQTPRRPPDTVHRLLYRLNPPRRRYGAEEGAAVLFARDPPRSRRPHPRALLGEVAQLLSDTQ